MQDRIKMFWEIILLNLPVIIILPRRSQLILALSRWFFSRMPIDRQCRRVLLLLDGHIHREESLSLSHTYAKILQFQVYYCRVFTRSLLSVTVNCQPYWNTCSQRHQECFRDSIPSCGKVEIDTCILSHEQDFPMHSDSWVNYFQMAQYIFFCTNQTSIY